MPSGAEEVRYRDRRTGEIVAELLLHETAQQWIYGWPLGFRLFNLLLNNSVFCRLYGRMQDSGRSRRKIAEFIKKYGIDVAEIERPPETYQNFNEFFTRRLKPGARPFVSDPNVLCSPADGKVLVYSRLNAESRIPVKGSSVTIEALLASRTGVEPYCGGAALIVRLAPYDYHRFHFPDSGEAGAARTVPGRYCVVHPVALERVPDAFIRNKRTVTEFASDRFGRIACVEVAGFAVGRIVQTYTPGRVDRGQEKGYFQFGGSTLVLLFEPGAIQFDEDLVRDSACGLEVHVQAGSGIGSRV